MIRVIIKGDKHQAALAASFRNIPFAFDEEIRHAGSDGLTVGNVADHYFAQISMWFCEPPSNPPYPIGACLHYAIVATKEG